jgi:hypothetical protein
MRRPSDGVVVAIIAALSAIGGTVVGAAVSYVGNEHLQAREIAQEEDRQTTASRAVARILMSEYAVDVTAIGQMLAEREYEAASYRNHTFVSHVGLEDRKLLAGRLTEDDWVDVSAASQAIEQVDAELEAHHGKGRIGVEERGVLESARGACESAYKALTPLAAGAAAS